MRISASKEIEKLVRRYPELRAIQPSIFAAVGLLSNAIRQGGKLLVCGNGGSAADSLHIVGELMKRFVLPRPIPEKIRQELTRQYPAEADYYLQNLEGAIPAFSLVNETALVSAYSNDKTADLVFAQQVLGYGRSGDILVAISTSGNSANVIHAARVARAAGLSVLALTGETGGKLGALSDILLAVPGCCTYEIQELHLPVYHALCLALEQELFAGAEQQVEP